MYFSGEPIRVTRGAQVSAAAASDVERLWMGSSEQLIIRRLRPRKLLWFVDVRRRCIIHDLCHINADLCQGQWEGPPARRHQPIPASTGRIRDANIVYGESKAANGACCL